MDGSFLGIGLKRALGMSFFTILVIVAMKVIVNKYQYPVLETPKKIMDAV